MEITRYLNLLITATCISGDILSPCLDRLDGLIFRLTLEHMDSTNELNDPYLTKVTTVSYYFQLSSHGHVSTATDLRCKRGAKY